jgi:hypothetical protein
LFKGSGAAVEEYRHAGQRRAIESEDGRSRIIHGNGAILKADDLCADRLDQRFA